jgi:voltage-gated sodium channel
VVKLARTIAGSEHFFDAVLVLLIIAALCMGAEATASIEENYGDLLATTLDVLQAAFVVEIIIRVVAYSPHPQNYFSRFWNSFDFIVVALSLLPAIGGLGLVSRLFRLARLIRIVSVSGALRNFSSGRTHGISAVASAALMLGLLWYVMALAGFYLFAASEEGHWGSLANGLSNVGYLLTIRNIAPIFSGIGALASGSYLAFLYLAELAIVLEMILHLLGRGTVARAGVP